MRLTHTNQKTHLLILYPIKGIAQMHGISSNEGTKNLWLNSKLEKSDNKPQISLRNGSAESVVAGVATLTKDTNLVTTMFLKLLEATSLVFILL